MKNTNHRFKIYTDIYGTSKRELILYEVKRHSVAHPPTILGLVWDLSSRKHALNSLGVNKSSQVRMFAFRELKYPTDVLDKLIHTLRNDHNTYATYTRLTPAKISTNINSHINEKIIIKEIEEGVI